MKLKKILFITFGIVLICAAGLIIFIQSYDFSQHLKIVEQWALTQTGRQIKFNGISDLKLGLSPVLQLNSVSSKGPSNSLVQETITIETIELALDLRTLFKKEIKIRHLNLNNCNISILNTKTLQQNNIKVSKFNASAENLNQPIVLSLNAGYNDLSIHTNGTVGSINQLITKGTDYPFHLNATINGSEMSLKGHFKKLETPPLYIDFTLKSDHINLGAFTDSAENQANETQDRFFSEEEFSLEFPGALNLSANIDISRLSFHSIFLENLQTRISMKKGKLTLKPIQANLHEGTILGDVSIEHTKGRPVFVSNLRIDRLDTHLLSKKMNGALTGSLNLKSMGKSVAQIMNNLNGPLWTTVENGMIEAGFIQSFGSDLLTDMVRHLHLPDDTPETTPIHCAALRLNFINGIGTTEIFMADSPIMVATAKGLVNLKKEHLDVFIQHTPKKGIGSDSLGKINLSIGQLARAFKVSGPFSSLKIHLDEIETTKNIAKTAGGILLFGPVGIITALAGTSGSETNPCPCSMEIAQQGSKAPCTENPPKTGNSKKQSGKDQSNPIKKLFNIFD